jgi:hypothetical protein
MTIVGKILVFIILAFSLVVGALEIVVYIARTNYAVELKKEKKAHEVDQANLRAYQDQVKEVKDDMQAKIDQHLATINRVQGDLKRQIDEVVLLKEKLEAEVKKYDRADATAKAAEIEVAKRQADVEKMRSTNRELMDQVVKTTKEKNVLQDKATAATIQMKAALDTNARLETQLQSMARDFARMRANGTTTTVAKMGQRNPPPDKIEGLVKTADATGLVKITLGSDAGLARGHTLEVFRLNPNNPNQSKYLGTIQIIDLNAHEAVGQPLGGGKMLGPVQAGDTVASRILGSS